MFVLQSYACMHECGVWCQIWNRSICTGLDMPTYVCVCACVKRNDEHFQSLYEVRLLWECFSWCVLVVHRCGPGRLRSVGWFGCLSFDRLIIASLAPCTHTHTYVA